MEQVNRASEEMMRSQTVISDVSSSPSPLMSDRSEQLDVERLNKLIRTFDKSWILPRSGSREPVGSNFQVRSKYFIEIAYFRSIHGNLITGEKMVYRCEDLSNAAYCKRDASFDSALAKHKKDSYKAKAYIHRVKNFTLLFDMEEMLTPRSALSPTTSTTFLKLKMTAATITKSPRLTRRRTIVGSSPSKSQITLTTMASLKTNAWKPTTFNSRSRKAPRLVPVWQKLLIKATTKLPRIIPTTEDIVVEEEKQDMFSSSMITHQTAESESMAETTTAVAKKHEESTVVATDDKISWKSLETTTSGPTEGDIPILEKPVKKNEPGFWMRYQPGKWFQSIQHLTNTGRK
uniref:Uncharacterized protein n=1 Tax=Ascaris lumbricoides TaxID=6252 RepID=A0A9J2PQR9_ASCLU